MSGWPDQALLSDMGDLISPAQVATLGSALAWHAGGIGSQQDGQHRWSPSALERGRSRGSSRGGSAGAMGLGDLGTIAEEDV
jgi:hypothetical protein